MPPDGYGGTELFCYELAEELSARGHDVTAYTTGDAVVSGRKRALYHRPIWPPTSADELNHAAWALSDVARDKFDVIHLNSALGLPLGHFLHVPIVYTIHHKREEATSRIFAAHPQPFYVAISKRQLDLEIPLPRSIVIHHGLSQKRYPPSFEDAGYLVHLGRYAKEKGTHTAIDIACRAGLPMRLAGRAHPEDRAYFEEFVAPRLALPNVYEHGEANHEQKVTLLRGARAVVCPIDWEEPFGLVAIEAMLCGTPVLAFARGSFPEIIEENVTGFLAAPGDVAALERAARALGHFDRPRCAKRARERFGTAAMTNAYEAVYRRAVATGQFARARVA